MINKDLFNLFNLLLIKRPLTGLSSSYSARSAGPRQPRWAVHSPYKKYYKMLCRYVTYVAYINYVYCVYYLEGLLLVGRSLLSKMYTGWVCIVVSSVMKCCWEDVLNNADFFLWPTGGFLGLDAVDDGS